MSTKRGPPIGAGWVMQGWMGHTGVVWVIQGWVGHAGVGHTGVGWVCHGGVGYVMEGWGGVYDVGVGWAVNNFICHKLGFLSFLLTNYYQMLSG